MSNSQEFQVVESRKAKRLARKLSTANDSCTKKASVMNRAFGVNPQNKPSARSLVDIKSPSPAPPKTVSMTVTFTLNAPGPRPVPKNNSVVAKQMGLLPPANRPTKTVEEKKAFRDAHVAKVRQGIIKGMLDEKRPSFVATKEHPTLEDYARDNTVFAHFVNKRLEAALKKEKIDRAIRNGRTVTCEQCQFGMEAIDENNYKHKKLCDDCREYWKELADEDIEYWSGHYAWLDSMQKKLDDEEYYSSFPDVECF